MNDCDPQNRPAMAVPKERETSSDYSVVRSMSNVDMTGSDELTPVISVCVSLKNRSRVHCEHGELRLFPNCVRVLASAVQTVGPIELVVADFESDDWPLHQWIDSEIGRMRLTVVRVEGGFSRGKGLNLASHEAASHRLLLSDADIMVDASAIQRAIEVIDAKKVWFPICMYLDRYGNQSFWQKHGHGIVGLPKNLAVSYPLPEFTSWGGEDDLLFRRLRKKRVVVREQHLGLRHQWHPDDLRDMHYERPRNADFHSFGKCKRST